MLNEITSEEYIEKSDRLIITKENFLEKFDELLKIIKNSKEFLSLFDRTQLIFDKKDNREGENSVYNRQTHTAYVANISAEIAKKSEFGLNEVEQKTAELIGWCHDLGHTAFGHAGERRVDKILEYFKISAEEFSDYYMGKLHQPKNKYNEAKHSFEHHAHSTRVLRKILSDNNITIESDLLDEIEWGIMCHSESRVKRTKIINPMWTIARYADKFYAFTDIMDIMKSGVRIPNNILETMKNDKGFEEEFLKKQNLEITQEDINNFNSSLDYFYKGDAFDWYKRLYIDQARLNSEEANDKTSYFIDTNGSIGRLMRILQAVVKYMRREGIIGKEDILTNAMVDEIVAYRIEHPSKDGLSEKSKVIEACLFITANTDTELRSYYGYTIARNKEWCQAYNDKFDDPSYEGFETRISREEREEVRKNPDIILNYNFDAEVEKVKDTQVKMKLYQKINEYRSKFLSSKSHETDYSTRRQSLLKERRELIRLIENAKVGGDPFFRRNRMEGPSEDRT